jgi:GT2 family glycosyltransferase
LAKAAVVILNWNGADLLQKFLPPLIEFTDPSLAEIWIADNGSTDNSLDLLSKDFAGVRVISLDKNYGFAGGYNLALEKISAEYFVLLNSDVEVSEGWLEPLISMLNDIPDAGACMPKIRSWHEREYFEHAGAAGGFLDRFGYPFCQGRIFNSLEKDEGQFDADKDIFWASGACLVIRSDLYRKSGGLDPFFFAHMEEIDLCWRIKNMGFSIKYCHKSKVYHVGGGTLPENDHKKTYLNFRNNLILLYKNLPAGRLLAILFPRIMLDFISIFQFLVRLEFRNMASVIKAHFFLLFHTGSIRHLRRQNLQLALPALHTEMYRGSIVYDFFIRGKRYFSDLRLNI